MNARNRRKGMLWLLVVLILSAWCLPSWAAQARNVILMIGDGMGPAHVQLAWLYATRQLNRPLVMTEVMEAGKTAYMVNDTADTTVTESAAAATQMATGVKVTAKAIGVGPDGKALTTILELAREKGKATGLVTTSGITDATPAAFAAHVDHRSNEEGIAGQLVKSNVNILFGGRREFFLPEAEKGRRKDGRNLIEEARKEGYTVVQSAEEMNRAEGMKLLGLFNSKNMLFEIDRKGSREPSLADMTSKAIDVLNRNGDGFFLMVEGGRIDHAAHHHDVGAMLHDTLAFDEAVARAYDFQKVHPDTLLIITADHETGGFIVLPYSPAGPEYEGVNLEALSKIEGSYEKRNAEFGKDPSPEKIQEVIRKYYGVELTPDQAQAIRGNVLKKYDPRHFQYNWDGTIALFLRLHHRIGWATDSHSATPLFLWGIGPGSEPIHGWRHNTEVFRIIRDAYGL